MLNDVDVLEKPLLYLNALDAFIIFYVVVYGVLSSFFLIEFIVSLIGPFLGIILLNLLSSLFVCDYKIGLGLRFNAGFLLNDI